MPRRILIAPDKFKGSLSALEAAHAMAKGFRAGEPDAQLDLCPIADGGEGFMKAMATALTGEWVDCPAVDALGRSIDSRYFLADTPDGSTAVLEMAETAGMWRLSPDQRNPLYATTRGVGMQIAHAIQYHAVEQIHLGLGGSATNDAGCGMAEAMGIQFLDAQGATIEPTPTRLTQIAAIDRQNTVSCPSILAACDVTNPLLGPKGATQVFGPQKGASPADLHRLEASLGHLVAVASAAADADTPGTGSAGGLGFGLLHFLHAQLVPGFDLLANLLDLDSRIEQADLIITGEGALDSQSMGGKGPVSLARRASQMGKPTVAFCGTADATIRDANLFAQIHPLSDTGLPVDTLMRDAASLLEAATREAPLAL